MGYTFKPPSDKMCRRLVPGSWMLQRCALTTHLLGVNHGKAALLLSISPPVIILNCLHFQALEAGMHPQGARTHSHWKQNPKMPLPGLKQRHLGDQEETEYHPRPPTNHLTLANCEFIQVVNVFFCVFSCSTVKKEKSHSKKNNSFFQRELWNPA